MTRVTSALAVLFCLAAPAVARAQTWELAGLFGVTPSSALERRASALDQLDIRTGFTWGLQASRALTPHVAAEVLVAQQWSALRIGTADGTADLFTMNLTQIHGNAVYYFQPPAAKMRPFVFGGLGVTILGAYAQSSETKLSFGFGGGVEYFRWKSIGVRGQFRYKPTIFGDEAAGDFCDPFGFCQGTLQQVEFAVGAVVRF